jgi:hypothetical protein
MFLPSLLFKKTMGKIILLELWQCLYCHDIVESEGEEFCCDDCYHEWHDENPDYEWDKDEKIYVIR